MHIFAVFYRIRSTLFAQSICPDKINHGEGSITCLFNRHMGEAFNLGGLAGVPFAGKSGFAALLHHANDESNIFVLYAP